MSAQIKDIDKIYHIVVSFLVVINISLLLGVFFGTITSEMGLAGFIASLACGIGKEVTEYLISGNLDIYNVLADITGASAGYGCILIV